MMNHFVKEIDESEENPKKTSTIIHEMLLDMYFIVARRIKGIGISLNEFWQTSANDFAYLYRREKEIIDKEMEDQEKTTLSSKSTSKSGKMIPSKYEDSEEFVDAYESYVVD